MMSPYPMEYLWRCRRHLIGGVLSFAILAPVSSAAASEIWEEAGSGAVAILPAPSKAASITGGSLVCSEQRWLMRLRTDAPGSAVRQPLAKVTIDGESFPVKVVDANGTLTFPVSYEMIEGLKSGGELVIVIGVDEAATPSRFPLRNSRAVIEAVSPRCSRVDMSPYQPIALSETDSAVETASPLLEGEVKLFRAATSANPKIAATRLVRGASGEMLFATVCGSSWYYGRSGCSLFGFLRPSGTDDWQQVYNTEGMALYLDPNASEDRWPDLVTLEPSGVYEPMHWTWNGTQYSLSEPQIAVDELRGSSMTP